MASIRVSAVAVADLDELWLYVADHDVRAADRIVDGVGELIALLEYQPEMGALRNEYGDGLRSLVFKRRVLVFYQVRGDTVVVLRVVRGERFLSAGLFDDE
jgi:toxin ParE1/3/4